MFTLTWCIFLPLVTAAILILIPSGWKGLIKSVSVIGALLTFIVSVNLAIGYHNDAGDIEGTDATTVLKDAQEAILGGVDLKVDHKGVEFRKAAYPPADSKSFNPEQYAAAKEAVRAFASSETAADEVEKAWKRALELEYALHAPATKHLRYTAVSYTHLTLPTKA